MVSMKKIMNWNSLQDLQSNKSVKQDEKEYNEIKSVK